MEEMSSWIDVKWEPNPNDGDSYYDWKANQRTENDITQLGTILRLKDGRVFLVGDAHYTWENVFEFDMRDVVAYRPLGNIIKKAMEY